MRKIRIYSALIMLLGLVACSKSGKVATEIEGDWKLESYYGFDAAGATVPAEVYIRFSDGQFELFQKLGGGHFDRYSGTYTCDGNVLSGNYSDGKTWASEYFVSFSDGSMTLKQYVNDAEYVCVYVRTSIPESVRTDASNFGKVKSSGRPAGVPWL